MTLELTYISVDFINGTKVRTFSPVPLENCTADRLGNLTEVTAPLVLTSGY